MCQIIVKPSGKKFDMKKLDKAEKWNEDGYGVTWYEDDELHTFKTMKFNRFKSILSTLKDVEAVAHLRNTTRGETCTDNNHPFDINSGVMFHNGTISGLTACSPGGSDTKALATLINECEYNYIEDIAPFIQEKIGTTINRLVFFEVDGRITIMNKGLGQEEDGIWYSNDYHEKKGTRYVPYKKPTQVQGYVLDNNTGTWVKEVEEKEEKLTKVFVYGTLKQGHGNHDLLKGCKLIGKAKSVSKWDMIGEGMPFPYLLQRNDEGLQIEGEVYEVNSDTARALDILEGIPHHYRKSYMYVSFTDGTPSTNAAVYIKTTVTEHDKARPYISNFIKKPIMRLAV